MFTLLKNQNLQPTVKTDLYKLKHIINDNNILYSENRYLYEFIFLKTKFDKNVFYKLDRASRQCNHQIRFSGDINGNLLITVDRLGFMKR